MSDAALREAERRWRASGHVEDEARFLLEQVRAGQLPVERLELAAYCGHGAALVAIGRPVGDPSVTDVKRWAGRLPRWRDVLGWRAALAAIEVAGEAATERTLDLDRAPEGPPTHAGLVRAVERWLLDPATTPDATNLHLGFPHRVEFEHPPGFPVAFGILGDAAVVGDRAAVLARVQDELVTWILGRGDPVRDRAALRS